MSKVVCLTCGHWRDAEYHAYAMDEAAKRRSAKEYLMDHCPYPPLIATPCRFQDTEGTEPTP